MKTHRIVAWRFGADGPARAAQDDVGNLVVFATDPIADVFASALRTYGLDAVVQPVGARDVADLLAYNEALDAADRVVVVEAQATSYDDAARWASELADRFVAKLVDGLAVTNAEGGSA